MQYKSGVFYSIVFVQDRLLGPTAKNLTRIWYSLLINDRFHTLKRA